MVTRRRFLQGSALSLLAGSSELSAQSTDADHGLDTPRMATNVIPASGELVPIIGLGTLDAFNIEDGSAEKAALVEILQSLVAHGGTIVDTSPSPRYGAAEPVLGSLAAELGLSDQLFFATKVFSEGKQEGMSEMATSLAHLQVPQIDLMQVHSLRDWENHLPSIYQLKEEGKVRYAGVTIHVDSGHELMAQLIRDENLDFVQVNYNLIERNAENEVLELAREHGVAVMVNVPFAKAELFRLTADADLPDWAAEFDCKSWAQFFLKYIVSHPAVTCVIPRTSKPAHMLDNLKAGFGRMPDAETRVRMEQLIDALAA